MPKRTPYRGAQPAVEPDEVILSGKLDETHSGTHRCDRQRRHPDDMEESGGARVIDESARLTGVDIRTRGFVGGTPSITLHGAGQNDLRLPFDGIDVTDTWGRRSPMTSAARAPRTAAASRSCAATRARSTARVHRRRRHDNHPPRHRGGADHQRHGRSGQLKYPQRWLRADLKQGDMDYAFTCPRSRPPAIGPTGCSSPWAGRHGPVADRRRRQRSHPHIPPRRSRHGTQRPAAKTFSKGRLVASWCPASDCFVRASAATAFRTPALYELYGPFVGDADLDPEESRSLDLDIERRLGEDTYPRGTLFYSETDKLIDDTTTYANMPGTVTRQRGEPGRGLPLTDAVRLDASYTYTEGDNPSELSDGNAWSLQFSDA